MSIYAEIAELPTAAVADVLRLGGLTHTALSSRIARLGPTGHLCGPAFCARGETALGGPEPKDLRAVRYEMFRRVTSGAVVVISTGGYDECAVLGENVALALRAKGCAGIVADGGARDIESLAAMDIPIFVRFATPVSSAGRWRFVALEEQVAMPGQTTANVLVSPGDVLLGDGDGVVVIPARHAADVASDTRRLVAVEEAQRPRFIAGEDPQQVYASGDRYGHVRRYKA